MKIIMERNYIVDGKFLEIILNIVYEQNIQLLEIISREEDVSKLTLQKLLPNQYEMKKQLLKYLSSINSIIDNE